MSIRFKLPVLGLLIWLISHSVNAQETKDGFIILPNGDYKYGTIQFQSSLNLYEECLFYSETKKEYLKYTPEKIQGYGVINGTHFITKEIAVNGNQEKHFLKKELDELVKLYSYNDNRFFVEKDDLRELMRNDYKTILSEALASCKNIQSTIKRTAFEAGSLRSLFLKYQRCTNPESINIHYSRFKFDALAGVELNNSKLTGGPSGTVDVILTDKTLLSVGVNTIFSLKKNRHFSLVTGVYYYQQNFYASQKTTTKDYSSLDKINLDYKELLIPLGLQYSLFKKEKGIMPYVKGAISIPVTIKSSLVWENEKEYTNIVFFERYNLPQKFKHTIPLTIAAGTTFNLIGDLRNVLEINYTHGGGKLKNGTNSLTIDSSRIIVLLGFRF